MAVHPFIIVDRLSPFIIAWHFHGHTIGIRWYGLSYVFSFFLAYSYYRGAMRRGRVPGLTMNVVDTITYSTAFGIVFGGRLAFVIQHLNWLRTDPLFPFKLTEGGMTFFGGLIGVLIALYWVGRKYGMGFLALTDIATFPAALGLALGRIANFINGELVGKPTDGKWGVIFPRVDNVPRYPSELYESASHFLMYAILILTNRYATAWTARPGRLSYLFLTMYGVERFLTDFYRQDDTYFGPFSTGQWASLVVGLAGIIGLFLLRAPHTVKEPPQSSDAVTP
jgi:phosphatidylglycerol:prolipoprotein diacylglycerol transferase